MTTKPTILRSLPGIKRDGTRFEGDHYTDGQWCRFQRGLPRKIGGYRAINRSLSEVSRGFTNFPQQGYAYCHSGSVNLLERFTIDANLNSSVISDRTPSTLTPSVQNQWMFQYQYNSSPSPEPSPGPSPSPSPSENPLDSLNYLIAHVAPNNTDVVNDQGGQIFFGSVTGTDPLQEIPIPAGLNATGGIAVLHPYLFYYGSDGLIGWSVAGDPTDLSSLGSGVARPWSQKVIKGMPLRAGFGSSPAGIFIAYDAVIRSSFVGGDTIFQFDTLATDTSIMSANSVIDYDGVIYWAGVDRFLMFNGVVQEVPNPLSTNWFFDNIRIQNRSKVFAVKVPKYGEIWWCYPRDDATECTHAVIYNVREKTWYDTQLPASMRTSGQFSNFLGAPLMLDENRLVWAHENGANEINGTLIEPIRSYFTTSDLSFATSGVNRWINVERIEPDFVQSGPMKVTLTGRANARAPDWTSSTVTIPEQAALPYQEIVVQKAQRRELRITFESNAVDGDYQMGQVLVHVGEGDGSTLA